MSGAPTADGFDITGLLQLPDGLLQLAAGIDGISSGLSELKAGFAASYGALKSAILEIPDAVITEAELGQLYQVNPAMKDTLDKLAAYYAAGVKTKAVYANVRPLFDSMDAALDQLSGSADQISSALKDTAAQIKGALENSDAFNQLGQLSAGLQALSAKYGDFHEGLMMFTGGISKLNKNYGSLDGGISGLADGADALSDGLGQAADGVSALNDGVKDLPQKTDKEIQKLMDDYDKSDVKPVSFASPKNLNTASVQFVMKTDKIEKPEPPATAPEPVHKETIWDRFISLFK